MINRFSSLIQILVKVLKNWQGDPQAHQIPIKTKKQQQDFSHENYTSLSFKENPGVFKMERKFRSILYGKNHNYSKLLIEISKDLDEHTKRNLFLFVLEELESLKFFYKNSPIARVLIFERSKKYGAVKTRARQLKKLLNRIDKENGSPITLINKNEFNPIIQNQNDIHVSNNITGLIDIYFRPKIDNYISNDIDNEVTIDYLSSLDKFENNIPKQLRELSKLIRWKTEEEGKIFDFAAWAEEPILTGRAELTGTKQEYLMALAKAVNVDTTIGSLKTSRDKAIKSKVYIKMAQDFITIVLKGKPKKRAKGG